MTNDEIRKKSDARRIQGKGRRWAVVSGQSRCERRATDSLNLDNLFSSHRTLKNSPI